jgi:hypothetical protein
VVGLLLGSGTGLGHGYFSRRDEYQFFRGHIGQPVLWTDGQEEGFARIVREMQHGVSKSRVNVGKSTRTQKYLSKLQMSNFDEGLEWYPKG